MKPIWLSREQFTLVDNDDYDYLNQWRWHAQPSRGTFYAVRSQWVGVNKRAQIRMHRVILGLKDKAIECDHIDRNGLNNQRNNLRSVTLGQNSMNKSAHKNSTSKYKGVSSHYKKWVARIRIKGRPQIYLGVFITEKEAAIAYDAAAKIHHGEFANLNFKQANQLL